MRATTTSIPACPRCGSTSCGGRRSWPASMTSTAFTWTTTSTPAAALPTGPPMPSTARAFPTSATGAGTMSTSWSRHWGSASTPLIRGCPTASAPPACGRIRAACPRAPIPPAAMRATTPPTPTAGNGSRRGGSTTSAPRSTGTSATRAWTTPRWPAGGRIR